MVFVPWSSEETVLTPPSSHNEISSGSLSCLQHWVQRKERGKRRLKGNNSRPWWVLVQNTLAHRHKHTHPQSPSLRSSWQQVNILAVEGAKEELSISKCQDYKCLIAFEHNLSGQKKKEAVISTKLPVIHIYLPFFLLPSFSSTLPHARRWHWKPASLQSHSRQIFHFTGLTRTS